MNVFPKLEKQHIHMIIVFFLRLINEHLINDAAPSIQALFSLVFFVLVKQFHNK